MVRYAFAIGWFSLLVAACGGVPDEVEIGDTRVASKPSRRVVPGARAQDRFDLMGTQDSMGGGAPSAEQSQAREDLFAYDVPEGWEELAWNQNRLVNLRPAGHPDAECYLSYLGGDGGGLLANVNRWRESQMGLEPLDAGELDALPVISVLGTEGRLVDLEGSFSGMGADEPLEGWKMLGVIVPGSQFTIFLKFTGPGEVVDAERDAFLRFVDSLRAKAPDGSSREPGPSAPAYAYALPDGWSEIAPSGMRSVNLLAGDQGQVECYVIELAGEAGGLVPNVNRWRGEVGAGVMSAAEVVALPRTPFLGHDCPIVEVSGDYQGMSDDKRSDSTLLGTMRIRPEGSVFLKMVGPADAVAALRDEFLAFAGSMEEK